MPGDKDQEQQPYNPSDPGAVAKKKAQLKEQRRNELNDLKEVLESPAARRLLWRVLGRCGQFRSIWEASARIHYNAGMQDLGHWLAAEIEEANQEAMFTMMREAQQSKKGEQNA